MGSLRLIAISGVHGIGKTTFVKELEKKYSCITIPESATHFLQNKYSFEEVDNDLDTFLAFQNDLLDDQIERLSQTIENRGTAEFLFADRSPLDSLAYVVERLSKERSLNIEYYEQYKKKVFDFMLQHKWERVFHLGFSISDRLFDWVWKREDYGDRNPNPFYLESLNANILLMYRSFMVLHPKCFHMLHSMNDPKLEDRMSNVKDVLEDWEE